MRTLIIIFTVILLVVTVGVSSAKPGEVSRVGGAVNGAVAAAGEPLFETGNGISSFFGGLIHFRETQSENMALKQQMADLEAQLAEAKLTELQYQELRGLYEYLGYESYDDSFGKVTVDVVANSGSDSFNIFTVNAGSESGVKKDDMVVNSDGLVGRVTDFGAGWSKVTGIVDSSNSVSFTVLRDPEIIGVISGDGQGGLAGYLFDDDKVIRRNDVLVTSGMGMYPAGIRLGTVTSVNINENTKIKEITAESSVDFDSLRLVTVLVQQR